MRKIQLPPQVTDIMQRLIDRKYEAYVVGEAVRKLYIGELSQDYDIITNADLERIQAALSDYRINEDYVGSGELIINVKGMTVMLAPYREGFTSDGAPIFTENLMSDLLRRDFTLNAICADVDSNIIDKFDGVHCLETSPYTLNSIGLGYSDGEISTASSVEKNPLNIMLALALASEGDYRIESGTEDCIVSNAESVSALGKNELRTLFERILMGKRSAEVLWLYRSVVFVIFPELRMAEDFNIESASHVYTLYEHLCKSVGYSLPDLAVRYALLFHGVGKPDCEARCGVFFFYDGHTERSKIYARAALERLGEDDELIDEVLFLIENHDLCSEKEEFLPENYAEVFTVQELRKIIQLGAANIRAKNPDNERLALRLKRASDELC